MLQTDPLLQLWQTPLGIHRFEHASDVNATLAKVFKTMRLTDSEAVTGAPFYASTDDLLQRIKLAEWEQLLAFIVDALRQTVVLANQGHWPQAAPGLQIAIPSIWFQMSQMGSHHDIHRFYGPHFTQQAGASMDFGNAYLQSGHIDIQPLPGQLVVFPSWLAHQAMPYAGEQDRIIVSFNARVHSAIGNDQIHNFSQA